MNVRFHLGNGPHCGHWQIRDGRRVRYVDPSEASLRLRGCRLVNRRGTAERIHAGAHKTPCAWVECDEVEVYPPLTQSTGASVRYNPRVSPHWIFEGRDADGMEFALLSTAGNKLTAHETRKVA